MLPGNTQRRRLIINASLSLHPRSPRGRISAKSSHSLKKPIIFLTRPFLLGQNRQVKKGGIVGTPPSKNTWHASYNDTWHALSSESPSFGSSYKAHMARFSGLPQGRSNDTYKHIIRTAYTIHPDDQHMPSGYNGPDH